jgi:MinD superfamily P-loop ATPase
MAGRHAARVWRTTTATTTHFRVPALVCVNKADIYRKGMAQIEAYCQKRSVEVVGRIPFDATVTEAMVQG